MVQCVRRREDDHRAAGPPDAPLPHRGDRQRIDPLQPQHGRGQEADQGARADAQGRQDRRRGRTVLTGRRAGEDATGYALRVFPRAINTAQRRSTKQANN
ncbi:hypothetical protein RA210_U140098 [Rubrivivax sp. A210]|nr:hypothetical protein RA210_U140098 [Rubrivivax sp. A210]